MQNQITNTLLGYTSKEISAGRPFWALLRFNEYQNTDSGIRRALCRKAAEKMAESDSYRTLLDIVERVISGNRLSDFSDSDKERIKNFREKPSITARAFSLEIGVRAPYVRRRDALIELRAQNG